MRFPALPSLLSVLALTGFVPSQQITQFQEIFEKEDMKPEVAHYRSLAVGDVTGDGHPDVVVGSAQGSPMRIYINNGDDTFDLAPRFTLPFNTNAILDILLEDLDGDGDLDLFGVHDAKMFLYLNDGDGLGWTDASASLPTLPDPTVNFSVAAGDVDGDGDADLMIGRLDQANALLQNDGNAGFTHLPQNTPAHTEQTWHLVLADLDGDGDLDCVEANKGQCRILENNGSGVFTDITAIAAPTTFGNHYRVAVGDVDGDGDLDIAIAVGGPNGGQNALWINDGTAQFSALVAPNWPQDQDDTVDVELFDADGDGTQDVIFLNNDRELHRYERMSTESPAGQPEAPAPVFGRDLVFHGLSQFAFGDTSIESTVGLLVIVGNGLTTILVLDPATRRFLSGVQPRSSRLEDGTSTAWIPVDWDGDEFQDYWVPFDPGSDKVVLGSIDPIVAASHIEIPGTEGITLAARTGDFDNDGDVDYFRLTRSGAVFGRKESDDSFSTISLPTIGTGFNLLGVGDFNGDGYADPALAGQHLEILHWVPPPSDSVVPYFDFLLDDPATALSVGDVTGDGVDDCAVSTCDGIICYTEDAAFRPSPTVLNVVANAECATHLVCTPLTLRQERPTEAPASNRAAIIAINGDPSKLLPQPNRIYTYDGNGGFTSRLLSQRVDISIAVEVADLNNDSFADLVILNLGAPPEYLLGDGQGGFSEAPSGMFGPVPDGALGVLAFDNDGDGDVDLHFLYNEYGPSVRIFELTNLASQVRSPHLARIGRGMFYEMINRAAGTAAGERWFFPVLNFTPPAAPLVTPWGLVRVNLDGAIFLPAYSVPADSTARFSFAIPNDPSLVGKTIDGQFLVVKDLMNPLSPWTNVSNFLSDVVLFR